MDSVLLVAATGIRISEALALKWSDVDYGGNRIHIRRKWKYGVIGPVKTRSSKAPVPMHPILAAYMQAWQRDTPYGDAEDWVFPSFKLKGKQPLTGACCRKITCVRLRSKPA